MRKKHLIFALPFFRILCGKTYDFKERKPPTTKTGLTGRNEDSYKTIPKCLELKKHGTGRRL